MIKSLSSGTTIDWTPFLHFYWTLVHATIFQIHIIHGAAWAKEYKLHSLELAAREARKQSSGFCFGKQASKWKQFPKHRKSIQKMLATTSMTNIHLSVGTKCEKHCILTFVISDNIKEKMTILFSSCIKDRFVLWSNVSVSLYLYYLILIHLI